jgi:uncharacterized protein (DUF3084 family)
MSVQALYNAVVRENESLRTELAAAQAEIDRMRSEQYGMADWVQMSRDFETQLAAVTTERDSLKAELAAVRAENERLQRLLGNK